MDNRIRIVNNISICFSISLCVGLIHNAIASLSSSIELNFNILFMTLRRLLPNIIGLVIAIIIIIICNYRYKHKKDDLKIKNNYFFIGTYLIIGSIVNFLNIPLTLYWLIWVREGIGYENTIRILVPNIAIIIFTILNIVIGIFMVLKDIQKKQPDIN